MLTTEEWAISHGVSAAPIAPPIADYHEKCPYSAREIAARTIALHCVSAVADGVEEAPVIDWLQNQRLWSAVTPLEQSFLSKPKEATPTARAWFQWRMESQWALLWVIGKIEVLGLPTRQCDTGRLCNEIMPQLGGDCESFLASGMLRPPGEILAEDDRHYNLWCYLNNARRNGNPVPEDLKYFVLWERVRAFEWLHGNTPWDDVQGDS